MTSQVPRTCVAQGAHTPAPAVQRSYPVHLQRIGSACCGLTKNPRPRARTRVGTSAGTLRNPSQVVRDGTAAINGCHYGAPLAGACSDRLSSSTRGQILPARSKINSYGNIRRRTRISILSVRNAAGQICGQERKFSPLHKNLGKPQRYKNVSLDWFLASAMTM